MRAGGGCCWERKEGVCNRERNRRREEEEDRKRERQMWDQVKRTLAERKR